MLALIRRALDARRLASELERAEARIAHLEARLSHMPHHPHFVEVAKAFDIADLHDDVRQRVINDLAPILERSALAMLKEAMGTLSRETRQPMTALAAYDKTSMCHEFRFEVPPMGTSIRAM